MRNTPLTYILLICFLSCHFLSCGKDEEQIEPAINIPIDKLEFLDNIETKDLSFTSTKTWIASTPDDWISLNNNSGGEGENKISISVDQNLTYEERTGIVTIKSDLIEKRVLVYQKQKDAILVSTSEYQLPFEGGEIEIIVKTNIDISIEIENSWIIQKQKRKIDEFSYTFFIERNTLPIKREGKINIINTKSNLSESITILQTIEEKDIYEIYVENAGTLNDLLGDRKEQIKTLILSGSLNGSDIKTIRSMDVLLHLDMRKAQIVAGGDSYFVYISTPFYTEDYKITSNMFRYLENIKSIAIPDNSISIGHNSFDGCSSLEYVSLSKKIESIGHRAFADCISLISVDEMPSFMNEIGEYAFFNCRKLKSITIPEGVTKLGYSTFSTCWSLATVSLPNSLLEIDRYVFFSCSFKSIIIPSNVTKIGGSSFQSCGVLENIDILSSVPPIIPAPKFDLYNPFEYCAFAKYHYEKSSIFVPKGSLSTYMNDEGWKHFSNISEK